MLSIRARRWFWAESFDSARASEISHGWMTTPTGPDTTSVDTTTNPSSSTTSVSPSRRGRAVPCTRLPPASSATNALAGRAISSSAVPLWTTRPSTRTAIRSARAAVSTKSCVTTIVGSAKLVEQEPQLGAHATTGVWIERGHRLVEEQDPGLRASALARATRWRSPPESWAGFALASEAIPSRSRVRRRRPRTTRFARRSCAEERVLLEHVADGAILRTPVDPALAEPGVAVDLDRPRLGSSQSCDCVENRGLACAGWADEADGLRDRPSATSTSKLRDGDIE